MKVSVLEFKLFEDKFCFNTEHIEYVFELESFSQTKGFHDSVIGITRYNKDIMLLVDTAKLYSNKGLDFQKNLSVIVIKDENGMLYGMIVDEIIKLEELQSVSASISLNSNEMIINHYKDKDGDEIVNEIHPLPLLKKYSIPSMAKLMIKNFKNNSQTTVKNSTNYLLFKIKNSAYAIDSSYVKEVLENDLEIFELDDENKKIQGAIAVRDEVIPLVSLKNTVDAHDIIVIELNGKKIAMLVDEVYDIENFIDEKVEFLSNTISAICGFYNHKGDVVAIVDAYFYLDKMRKKPKDRKKEPKQNRSAKLDYLVFLLDNRRYSIDMKCVRQVLETDSLAKTHSSSIIPSEDVAFIATWNRHAINIIDLKRLLDLQDKNNNTQTIIIEHEEHLVAFMVQDIDNIVYLDKNDISNIKTDRPSLISGAIFHDSEVIVTLNAAYLATLA